MCSVDDACQAPQMCLLDGNGGGGVCLCPADLVFTGPQCDEPRAVVHVLAGSMAALVLMTLAVWLWTGIRLWGKLRSSEDQHRAVALFVTSALVMLTMILYRAYIVYSLRDWTLAVVVGGQEERWWWPTTSFYLLASDYFLIMSVIVLSAANECAAAGGGGQDDQDEEEDCSPPLRLLCVRIQAIFIATGIACGLIVLLQQCGGNGDNGGKGDNGPSASWNNGNNSYAPLPPSPIQIVIAAIGGLLCALVWYSCRCCCPSSATTTTSNNDNGMTRDDHFNSNQVWLLA